MEKKKLRIFANDLFYILRQSLLTNGEQTQNRIRSASPKYFIFTLERLTKIY